MLCRASTCWWAWGDIGFDVFVCMCAIASEAKICESDDKLAESLTRVSLSRNVKVDLNPTVAYNAMWLQSLRRTIDVPSPAFINRLVQMFHQGFASAHVDLMHN